MFDGLLQADAMALDAYSATESGVAERVDLMPRDHVA